MDTYLIILGTYIVYSIIGFIFLRSYAISCFNSNIEPFGGSMTKTIAVVLLCGGISTVLFLFAVISEVINYFFFYEEEDEEDEEDE